MKHLFWAGILTTWLTIAGWVTLTALGRPQLAWSVAKDGSALAIACATLLFIGLFSGALDE